MEDIKNYVSPSQKGLLLINLGSPKSTKVGDVRRYLREFLMDPYVIDIPYWKRFLLVNGIIAPLRAFKSAAAYKEIWTDQGSPLIITTENLGKKVQKLMGDTWQVKVAMRYQEPSMMRALTEFKAQGITELHVLPLYPQYALSSTEAIRAKLNQDQKALDYWPKVLFKEFFYQDEGFCEVFAKVIDHHIEDFKPDALLFSYHGIPERHVRKVDPTTQHCLVQKNCCEIETPANAYCYKAHCFRTTNKILSKLVHKPGSHMPYKISFQSRLGKDPWIKPYTDLVAEEWAKQGAKRLAVTCPAFVADCLETLEEIAGELRESFIKAGGEDLRLIPSLNESDDWAKVIAGWYK